MLRVFVGNDVVAVRKETHEFLDKCAGEVTRITSENYAPGMLDEYISAQSLFGGQEGPVVLDFLSERDGALESIDEVLSDLAAASRMFVYIDIKPKAAREKLLRMHAEMYQDVEEGVGSEKFNTFALADAFAHKDKKSLWVLYMRARMAGVAPEEVAGVLFWQIKSLLLAARTATAAEAGMKDYPYRKAKGALKEFKKSELEKLSKELLLVYHRGHADSAMDLGLERFLLAL